MRIVALSLLLLWTLALAGCQSKAAKVKNCRTNTTPNTRLMPRTAWMRKTAGASRMLTGEKLTTKQIATLEAKRKERDARCKPEADRLAQLQREILAAQQ